MIANAGAWAAARNVLCVRLDGMGDVIMTSPALRAVRAGGLRRVTLLTSSAGTAAASRIPEVDDVICYDPPWMKQSASAGTSADQALIGTLAGRRFDAAMVFTLHSQSALPAAMVCYLAEIPLRVARVRENPYRLLSDYLSEDEPDTPWRHDVERQLSLAAAVGFETTETGLSLSVAPADTGRVGELLETAGVDVSRPWFVLHPGATAESRRYPPERFASAARELLTTDGWQVVVTGSTKEAPLADEVVCELPRGAVSLAGRLSFGELTALIAAAPLLITNNTGPAHIAAAVGTPEVVLYALTNPQHTPWQARARVLSHDVSCRNCYRSMCPEGHHACLLGISAAEVVEAARSLAPMTRMAVPA